MNCLLFQEIAFELKVTYLELNPDYKVCCMVQLVLVGMRQPINFNNIYARSTKK